LPKSFEERTIENGVEAGRTSPEQALTGPWVHTWLD
jgi:hypothetical protein